MASIRVLHVDDEPDLREIVEISLGLDPAFAVRSCASGGDAIAAAADWLPDLILLDVMMPDMDGPTTLARMRARPQIVHVPVVFLTVCAQSRERERFLSLGAAGVIAKPFNPMMLAAVVRRYAPAAETDIDRQRNRFLILARTDAAVLKQKRSAADWDSSAMLHQIESIAHDIAEAAGVYGFHRLSVDAGALADAIVMIDQGAGAAEVERRIDDLLARIDSESVRIAVLACRETAARFNHGRPGEA
jgi:two-component system OmpR family response regulator